jgi:drug/metabolite transporter (DMT)-like permease
VPALALALALAAALLHALWNVLLARAPDVGATTAVAVAVAVVAFAPFAAATWRMEASAVPYVAASSALQLTYFVLLAAAYRRAELSLVYPLARGLAPVLVLAVAVAALGAGTSPGQVAGVLLVAAGVLLVRGLRAEPARTGVLLGLAVASAIAGYTLVDNAGIEHADAVPYLELVLVGPAIVYLGVVGRDRARRALRPVTVAIGLASFGAYVLVLAALDLAPAAPVAAVRETSVVIATALAALVLRERVGPGRLAGAVLVAAGVVALGVTAP